MLAKCVWLPQLRDFPKICECTAVKGADTWATEKHGNAGTETGTGTETTKRSGEDRFYQTPGLGSYIYNDTYASICRARAATTT